MSVGSGCVGIDYKKESKCTAEFYELNKDPGPWPEFDRDHGSGQSDWKC